MSKKKYNSPAGIKKNDEIELYIEDVNSFGSGVGKYNGMAVFVPLTAVGDRIICRIVKVQKSYAYGIISKVIGYSEVREDRGCGIYSKCGGCVFRHISYNEECRIKEKAVRDAFYRVSGIDELPDFEFIGAYDDAIDRYRNKAQFPLSQTADGRVYAGFFATHSHRCIECEDCRLLPQIFSEIVAECLMLINAHRLTAYDEETHTGLLRHIFLRRGHHSGEIMLAFVATAQNDRLSSIAEELCRKFPDIKSVMLNINPDSTNVILGDKSMLLTGEEHIMDIMCGKKIRLSLHSFYQVNTSQAEKLYAKALEYAAPRGDEELIDLYCGAGTIGLSMAGSIGHLTGVEIVPQAIENAKANAHENGIEADFICADAGKAAKMFSDKGVSPDIIVTDPPRKGCDNDTLENIIKMSPEKIIMISCNPQTGARDIKYLCENGYSLIKAAAVDLYPGTAHVETVVLLSQLRQKPD